MNLEPRAPAGRRLALPAGITGFGDCRTLPRPIPSRQIRRLCHALALKNGGSVLSWDDSLDCRNFYTARISLPGGTWLLLVNAYWPFGAFAAEEDPGNICFVDIPVRLPDWFPAGFCLLGTAELSESCRSPGVLDALMPAEREQVRYWKPLTAGEIVFNFWD